MNQSQLLEERLRVLLTDDPPAALRDRVLLAVNAELSATSKQGDRLYWIALAASVLIVMNVSLTAGSRNEFSSGPVSHPPAMADELQAVQVLDAQQEHK